MYICPLHAGSFSSQRRLFSISVLAVLNAGSHPSVLKVDLLETDCQLTKDGVVVLFHDASLKRMTGIDLLVRNWFVRVSTFS